MVSLPPVATSLVYLPTHFQEEIYLEANNICGYSVQYGCLLDLLRQFMLKIWRSWCRDSSVVRFLRIDPMVNGSSPLTAELSLRGRRIASSLYFQA